MWTGLRNHEVRGSMPPSRAACSDCLDRWRYICGSLGAATVRTKRMSQRCHRRRRARRHVGGDRGRAGVWSSALRRAPRPARAGQAAARPDRRIGSCWAPNSGPWPMVSGFVYDMIPVAWSGGRVAAGATGATGSGSIRGTYRGPACARRAPRCCGSRRVLAAATVLEVRAGSAPLAADGPADPGSGPGSRWAAGRPPASEPRGSRSPRSAVSWRRRRRSAATCSRGLTRSRGRAPGSIVQHGRGQAAP